MRRVARSHRDGTMEAAAAAAATALSSSGPSTGEVAHEQQAQQEEGGRHYAITASAVPKPAAATLGSPFTSASAGSAAGGAEGKDGKSTRFHEDCHETDVPSPRLRSSRLYKGKVKDAVPVEKELKKPLCLLDLPVDVLKEIVKEVTHTNDLTSLALCHSALHRLAVPHIYSRFDIVWPDTSVHSEPRSGVDALTYGLATLVMAEEVFGEAPWQRQPHDGRNRFLKNGTRASAMQIRRRRGNHYAQFTRKFSLGNGPADWVQEYLITKEGGKMLGTLVALAVARMRSLETFVWDMPTGILRDVWAALSSLEDREDGRPCRLEKVWVRWHDNSSPEAAGPVPPPPPPPMHMHGMGPAPPQPSGGPLAGSPGRVQIHPAALDRVEHPSFSVLPALKSLSVLDIDELAYLDEMAVLMRKSLDKLRELRVGIARHATTRDWVTVWEGNDLPQVDHEFPTAGSLTIGERRNGGVLGTLTGFICDMRKPRIVLPERTRRMKPARPTAQLPSESSAERTDTDPITEALNAVAGTEIVHPIVEMPAQPASDSEALSPELPYGADPLVATSRQASPMPTSPSIDETSASPPPSNAAPEPQPQGSPDPFDEHAEPEPLLPDQPLRLDILELERVPLSIPVLQRAVDWTRLTSITFLHCQNHEALWKTLRRQFAPTPQSPTYPASRRSSPRKGKSLAMETEMEYKLQLKKVHCNTVSPALISFLRETLAPNSLEVLFLQEGRGYNSPVAVDAIFRGPIRRHRASLKKVLIDSSEKNPEGLPTSSSRWRRWMLGREVLSFMCSGKMPALRELGLAIDYRDWVSPLRQDFLKLGKSSD